MMPAARQQKILEMMFPTGIISIADAATRLGMSQLIDGVLVFPLGFSLFPL
jgi:hypothetical protein